MFANPVQQSALKADIMTEALGLDPLVAKDLLPLGKELLVKARLLYEIPGRFGGFGRSIGHSYHGDVFD
ncbi:MAG: hypothetical protein QM760_18020 [Nibricoccus sp.]